MPFPGPGGALSKLNLSATTAVTGTTATAGWLFTINVTVAGATTGAIYDNDSTSTGNTAGNLIAVVPEAVGSYPFYGFPYQTGLVFVPGTNQVVSISYT